MRDIKVTIVGDSGVGKSSLVTALVKDSFSPRVQAVVPEILLPLDVTDAGVTTRIVDTSSCSVGGGGDGGGAGGSSKASSNSSSANAERRAHLEASLRSADVVLLVYDVARPTTFDRIPTYWLPYLRSLIGSRSKHVPVILVGNKIDARVEAGGSSGGHGAGAAAATNENLEEELAPVMAEFGEVESCIETSVKEGVNVSEVFYFAQKAVLYPTAPLYDGKTHTLRSACIDALKRIFLLCDADKDHLLSDEELNEFQRRCFGSPLSTQELEAIKDLVIATPYYGAAVATSRPRSSSTAGASSSSNGGAAYGHPHDAAHRAPQHPNLYDGKLTLSGWLHLHTLFIQKGRLETTWSVLSSYGYGPTLTLTPEYLNPPSFHVPSDCAVELSPYGYSFLTDIFEAHDADRDGALCDEELQALFATAPGGRHPWEGTGFPTRTTTTDDRGAVTLQGWLAQWSMTTLLDYKITLAYLAYLGYPGGAKRGLALPQQQQQHSHNDTRRDGKPSPPPTGTALKLTRRNTRSLFSSAWSSYTASTAASYQSPPKTSASNSRDTSVEDSASKSSKKKKRGDPTERSVFLAYVLGAPNAGKSSLLNAALGKRFDGSHDEDAATLHGPRSVVTAVEPHLYYSVTSAGERGPPLVFGSTGGYERYLVLQEFPVTTLSQGNKAAHNTSSAATAANTPPSLLTSPHVPSSESTAAAHSTADVILLLYDSSDSQSFSYLSNLRQRYASTLGSCPTLIVASKADKEIAKQRHEVQPEIYVRRLGLERWSPMRISVGGGVGARGVGMLQGGGGASMAGTAGGGTGLVDDVDALGGASLDSTTAATGTPSSAATAATTTTTTTSMPQLLAVACAIAQDPRGNAAVPGLRAAHDRAGGSSSSWGSWLAGLVGFASGASAASKDEAAEEEEEGDDDDGLESEYDSDEEEEASSPGQADEVEDDSSSPSPAASSTLSSSVASSGAAASTRQRRRRSHAGTSTADQNQNQGSRSGRRSAAGKQRAPRASTDSNNASTKTMRRNRHGNRMRNGNSATAPRRRHALLVAFGVVLVGGGAVAAAAAALGLFEEAGQKRVAVGGAGSGSAGAGGVVEWGIKAPRRWAASLGGWVSELAARGA